MKGEEGKVIVWSYRGQGDGGRLLYEGREVG